MLKKPDKNPTSLYKPQRIQSFCRQKIRNLCVHMRACTHVCIHITECVCLIKCVGSLCALSFSSCCRESAFSSKKKKAAHNYKFHSEEHKEGTPLVDVPGEKTRIYSLLWHLQPTAIFVFVMEHVDGGNCHVIAPCSGSDLSFSWNVKGTILRMLCYQWWQRNSQRGFKSSAYQLECSSKSTDTLTEVHFWILGID